MIKYIIYSVIFLYPLFSQEHFNVTIQETGESTLFIFQDSIIGLDIGDELGLFDLSGIIDLNGNIGEILVGSGIWTEEQLAVVTINSVDLSDFGGPILPGAITGNPMILKIWDTSEEIEYDAYYYIATGTGTFNGLFTAIHDISATSECGSEANCGCMDTEACNYDSNADFDDGSCSYPDAVMGECDCNGNVEDCAGECGGEAVYDVCGVCDGPGAIYECGCYDIPDGDCDCVGNILDACEVCGGDDSICSDCEGVPNGNAEFDECGVCNGDNSTCSDCEGEPNGDALVDNCGICNGDSSSCDNPEAVLSFYDMGGVVLTNVSYENLISEVCLENVILSSTSGTSLETAVGNCIGFTENTGNFPIYMKNTQSVAGFQFNITGLTILEASGGAAEDAAFIVSTSESTVLGFSFSGGSMNPSGDFYGCLDSNACNYDSNATINDDSCEYTEEGFDCDGNCLNEDCLGECGGDAQLDECGICEGPGAIFECEDGTFTCNESECFTNCYDTDCGFYLQLGLTCEYAMEYGADCTLCQEQGYCDDDGGGGGEPECEDNEIEDCFDNCGPASWLGDGYCDESMTDFNCLALAYDMGDCEIDFSNHVMPLINANCTGYCHSGAADYEGGLNLETYTGLMTGGNSGDAVMPYYPDISLIIQKLEGTAPGAQMPYNLPPLPDNYINTIYYWIEQGALPPDDGGWEDSCVEDGEIEDCSGECVDENLLGDGNCDDGEEGEANLNCAQFIFDDADCPVGILEFGDYIFNDIDGTGTIEILMNCEFPVSNFVIAISGLEISGLYGGASQESDFSLTYTSSSISGDNTSSSYVPPNSGLLTTINFSSIYSETTEICFSNSTITTSAGYEYNAVLGDCISVDLLGDFSFIPNQISIDSIYPNPFNPTTTISYYVSSNQNIRINIYDLNGKLIETLINSFHGIGNHFIDWNADSWPTGVYLVELKGIHKSITDKITLIK